MLTSWSGIWNVIWPIMIGGCQLTRKTKETVLRSADWEVVELDDDEGPSGLFPRVWGRLKKKKAGIADS
jgi:hypothetical protein